MANRRMRMADLGARLNLTKMSQSERSRALMAMRQAEALVDLAQGAFTQVRRLMTRTRPGRPSAARSAVGT
jgi:hypothetical protein